MRRALVLVVLLGLMLGLSALKTDPPGVSDPLTLAAIGFVLLAAFTVAEIGSSLSLPRVTGYIIAGALLGPYVSNILSTRVVEDMTMFNNLALGLIALGAGLELDARQIGKIWKTLASTIAIKVLLCVVLVGGTLYAVEMKLGLLKLAPGKPLFALALIMGTLAIGTSPSISLAIISENRAKGRLSDIVLGSAVMKDLVVVVGLAIAIGVANGLVSPGTSDDANVLLHIAEELGGGAALGVLLILYIRFIRAEMLLFVAGMIVVVAEVVRQLHLDLLLVFIAAGFVVRNFSKYEHELIGAVERVALPIFIVFFTIAGARVDLPATYTVFPIALALCVVRAGIFFFAGRVGGVIGGEADVVKRNAWLGYLPLAGVTLGLVTVAAKGVPELATQIRATGMAMVAINLLIGPITLKRALKAAGDIGGAKPSDSTVQAGTAVGAALLPAGESRERVREALAAIGHEPLADHATRLFSKLEALGQNFREEWLTRWSDQRQREAGSRLRGEAASPDLEAQPKLDAVRKGQLLEQLFQSFQAALRELPDNLQAPLTKDHTQRKPGDSWLTRARRLRKRVAVKLRLSPMSRTVALQSAARISLEARLGAFCAEQLSAWSRAELAVLMEFESVSSGKQDVQGASREIELRVQKLQQAFDSELHRQLVEGVEQLAQMLRSGGAPELPTAKIRASAVDAPVKEALKALSRDPVLWDRAIELCEAEVSLARNVYDLRLAYEDTLQSSVIDPATVSLGGVEQVLSSVERSLTDVRRRAEEADLQASVRHELAVAAREAFDDDEQAELEVWAARFRASASMHAVSLELRAAIDKLPPEVEVPRVRSDARSALGPPEARSRRFSLQREARATLLHELLPSSDAHLRQVAATVVDTAARLREARDIALAVLETDDADSQVATLEQLDRALARLDGQRKALERDITAARDGLEALAEASFNQLLERSGVSASQGDTGSAQRLIDRLLRAAGPLRARLRKAAAQVVEVYRGAARSQLGRDVIAQYQSEHFDATTIRQYTARWKPAAHLPQEYLRLFAPDPITEHRLFSGYADQLAAAQAHEASWLAGDPGNLLLVGPHGSGRSSLLNLLELELRAPRIIRPEPLEWRRAIGIFGALAIELGTKPNIGALAVALANKRSSVLLDDLEQWFKADVDGLRQLERFLDLVVRTRRVTNWVIAVERGALDVLEELIPVAQVCGRVVQLSELSGGQLEDVIIKRHALSGRELVFPTTLATRVLARMQRTNEREVFFGLLARASSGNIGRAIALWSHGATITPNGNVKPSIDIGLSFGLPFIQRMEPTEIATLVQVMRFGPQDEAELARALALNRADMARHVHYLTAAGLLEALNHPHRPLNVPSAVRPALLQALNQIGA